MIVEMVKAAIYIFPFIKELFLGKSKDKKDGAKKDPKAQVVKDEPESKAFHYLRQVLITVAILSVMGNVVLVQKIFTMGSALLSLKKEVAAVRQEVENPLAKPPPVADANLNTVTPQELEKTVKPGEPVTPAPPLPVPDNRLPEAAPPRDEHVHAGRRRAAPSNSSRQASPSAVEPDKHYHRLRRLDDIR